MYITKKPVGSGTSVGDDLGPACLPFALALAFVLAAREQGVPGKVPSPATGCCWARSSFWIAAHVCIENAVWSRGGDWIVFSLFAVSGDLCLRLLLWLRAGSIACPMPKCILI